MKTLIKGGTIITADEVFQGDILIKDEKIQAIGLYLQESDPAKVIAAHGKLIMPGGIDVHTHFDLPMSNTVSSDDHYSGHKAAAFGGTTTVIDFISQDKEELKACVDVWHEKVGNKAAVDYGFHMNISTFNQQVASEIPKLMDMGINTIKVFTAYTNRLRLNDGYIFKVMRIAKENGMLVMVHAENGDVIDVLVEEALKAGHTSPVWHAKTRPSDGAVEAVYRVIKLSELAGAPVYIVHMNTRGGVAHVREARMRGLPIMGETCPQYLFFTEKELMREDGPKWICSPPLRTENDVQALWNAVEDHTLQVIATDHCPFFYDGRNAIRYEDEMVAIPGKELGWDNFTKIPNGLPGVGDRMMVMWTNAVVNKRISANQFVQLMCTNPAKIFGLYPQKGTIQPGSDADLTIWNPEKEITYGRKYSFHRTDYNLFEGMHLKGVIEKVFLRGKMIVDGSMWLGKPGGGVFLHRKEVQVL